MRAVVLREHGAPEVLTISEVPDPVPGPEEVLVEICSTALNRADLLQRRGLYPGPPMPFEIPGLELAGRVLEAGERARAWSPGDAVMGIVGGGAYAERIAVHERQLLPVPSTLPLGDAAAIPEAFLTSWDALVLQGGLTSGRLALVHAGGSGVGTAAIQVAKAIGAEVAVTASTSKVQRCRELGADLVVDYTREDFVEPVRELSRGRGVDVVLDVVGGDYLGRNLEVLAIGGRIVQVGVMGDASATVPLAALLPKRAAIIGTVLRSRPVEEKIALTQRFGREVLALFERGRLVPVIDSRFPFERITDAHHHMESNSNIGKILIDL